jgi:hypothetical protein
VVHRDIKQIYRLYDVNGYGFNARRALAAKLGVSFVTRGDQRPKNDQIPITTQLCFRSK